MSADDGFSNTALELADARSLPTPRDLAGILRANLEEVVTDARKNRGEVLTPEDTYEIQRGLAKVIEGLTDYANVFRKIAKEAAGYVEDELIDAVGEQDGIPTSGLKVPDRDGTTVCIELDKANVYGFDTTALFNAVAYHALASIAADDGAEGALDGLLVQAMLTAMTQLVELGKFEPQIRKVEAFTAELSRFPGGDTIASTVTGTIRKKPVFKGVKVRREQPK